MGKIIFLVNNINNDFNCDDFCVSSLESKRRNNLKKSDKGFLAF